LGGLSHGVGGHGGYHDYGQCDGRESNLFHIGEIINDLFICGQIYIVFLDFPCMMDKNIIIDEKNVIDFCLYGCFFANFVGRDAIGLEHSSIVFLFVFIHHIIFKVYEEIYFVPGCISSNGYGICRWPD
jgi:hypothetical protein